MRIQPIPKIIPAMLKRTDKVQLCHCGKLGVRWSSKQKCWLCTDHANKEYEKT